MPLHGSGTRANFLPGWLILAILFAIVLMIYNFLKKKTTLNNSTNNNNLSTSPMLLNLSKEKEIFDLLKLNGLNDNLSKWATSQAAHETKAFTSNIFLSNNNAFGMKYAGQVTALGEKSGYAYYYNVENSVKDFVQWYSRHRNNILSLPLVIFNLSDYVKFMKNQKYFEAPESEYLAGCLYYYNLLFNA